MPRLPALGKKPGPENKQLATDSAARLFAQPAPLTNYICHWSPKRGYVYVETPKVACTTIKRVLQSAELGNGRTPDPDTDVHARAQSPLSSPHTDPDGFLAAMRDPACFRFGFVRNPFSRTLSCWLDKLVGNPFERARLAPKLGFAPDEIPSFADFLNAVAAQDEALRDIHWMTQTYLLRPNRVQYSFIGRFELFRPQFLKVCAHLGIEDHAGDLPDTWHATDASEKVRSHVGEQEAALIRRIYEADFRNFGYGWNTAIV